MSIFKVNICYINATDSMRRDTTVFVSTVSMDNAIRLAISRLNDKQIPYSISCTDVDAIFIKE